MTINQEFVNLVSDLQAELNSNRGSVRLMAAEFFANKIKSLPDEEGKSAKENLASKARTVKNQLDDFSRALVCIVFDQDDRLLGLIMEQDKIGGLQEHYGTKNGENQTKSPSVDECDESAHTINTANIESLNFEPIDNNEATIVFKEPEEPIEFLVDFVKKSFFLGEDRVSKIEDLGLISEMVSEGEDIKSIKWHAFPNDRSAVDYLSYFGRVITSCFRPLSNIAQRSLGSLPTFSRVEGSSDLDDVNHGDKDRDELELPFHGKRNTGANYKLTYPEDKHSNLHASVNSVSRSDNPTYPVQEYSKNLEEKVGTEEDDGHTTSPDTAFSGTSSPKPNELKKAVVAKMTTNKIEHSNSF